MIRGVGMTPRHLSDMLVNVPNHEYQEYMGFMGGNLNHFQDNFRIVWSGA